MASSRQPDAMTYGRPLAPGGESHDPVVHRLRNAWIAGDQPNLVHFLAETGPPLETDRLIALVEIDQHYRWLHGERPLVESYLAQFPQLVGDKRTLTLILAEMILRRSDGEAINMDVFRQRFPQFSTELAAISTMPVADATTLPEMKQETPVRPPVVMEECRTVRLQPGWESQEPILPAEEEVPAKRMQIGPYEIERVLNHGGMGVIYQAIDTRLKRRVALKMILGGAQADPATLARFRGEAEAVALLQHPNIVQIFEVGEHERLPFLALEFVEGKNLQQVIADQPPTPRAAAALVMTLARAVEFAHQRGIVHRDLKPGNILITPDGSPKITDFGLAKLKGANDTHSRPGEVIGTPNYMAPEQAEGDPRHVGPGADVYSLGAVLYELLTRQPPFHGTAPMQTLLRLRLNKPIPPRQLQSKLPADLETICLKCLEKDRKDRYLSAQALADDLQRFLDGRPIEARPVGPVERFWKWSRRHPAIAGLTLLIAAGTIGSYGVFLAQWRNMQMTQADLDAQKIKLTIAQSDLENQRAAALAAEERAEQARCRADWITYLAQLNEAEREYDTFAAAKARLLLDQCDPGLRAWEWNYLRRRIEGNAITIPTHEMAILALHLAADEREFIAVTGDGQLLRFATDSGAAQPSIRLRWKDESDRLGLPSRASFSPAGDRLAADCIAPGVDGVGRWFAVWDTATGELIRRWPFVSDGTPERIIFSQDGRQVVLITGQWRSQRDSSGWHSGSVTLFDVAAESPVWRMNIEPNQASFLDAGFHPDGQRLVLVGPDTPLTLIDRAQGRIQRKVSSAATRAVGLGMDPQGKFMVTYDGQNATLLDVEGKVIGQFHGHVGNVGQARFSRDGRRLVTSATDHTVRVWDIATRRPVAILAGHSAVVPCVAVGSGRQHVVSYGIGQALKVWDLTGSTPRSFDTASFRDWTPSIIFDREGRRLISGSGNRQVVVWDMATGQRLRTHTFDQAIMNMALSPDGQLLAVALEDVEELPLIDPMTGEIRQMLYPDRHVLTVNFSPSGKELLVTGEGGLASIWDVEQGTEIARRTEHTGSVMAAAFSPKGDLVATAGSDGPIRLWKLDGTLVRTIDAHATQVSCLTFSPDGTRLASANQVRGYQNLPALIRIWDVVTGERLQELRGHDESIWCLAYHPDGTRLASGSEDKTVKIWAPNQGQWLLTLKGHTDDVRCVTFSPNGYILASSNDDHLIRFWDATPMTGQK